MMPRVLERNRYAADRFQNQLYARDEMKMEGILRDLFDNSPNAIVIVRISSNGRPEILDMNDTACNQLGYTREEFLNMSLQDLFSTYRPADSNLQQYYAPKHFEVRKSVKFESTVTRKDGTQIPMEITLLIRAEDGQKTAVLIAHDITKYRKSAEALKEANRKLTLATSITRHDIINQINVIRGYLGLMKKTSATDPQLKEYLHKEEKAAETITQLIQFSHDYDGIGAHEPRWQDLKMTIVRAIQSIDLGKVNVAIDTGFVKIYADLLLEKVFFNLVDNAIRYGEKITRIWFYCLRCDDGMVIVCEDDGIGIPDGEKENIFCRQYYRHTGLGMSLSRDILAITGLSIRETGTPGVGARFEIIIPRELYQVCPDGELHSLQQI